MLTHLRPLIRDIAAKIFFISGLTLPSSKIKQHPLLVVTFHRVLPSDLLRSYPFQGLAVTPDEFSWFLRLFKKYFICGTLVDNFNRWTSGNHTNRPLLSITFDDGQLDNFVYAEPILATENIPATFFVVTNGIEYNEILWYDRLAYAVFKISSTSTKMIDNCLNELSIHASGTPYIISKEIVNQAKKLSEEERLSWIKYFESISGGPSQPSWDGMMNWKQLKELINKGHEIGSHSVSHPILPLCSEIQLFNEIVQSKKIIENKVDLPISSFCYPNGSENNLVTNLVKQAGYKQAVTTKWGENTYNDYSSLLLNRFDIQNQTSISRNGLLSESRLLWRLSPFFSIR